jgi:hypothetical protein
MVSMPAVGPQAMGVGRCIPVAAKMHVGYLCESIPTSSSVDCCALAAARSVETVADLQSSRVLRERYFITFPVHCLPVWGVMVLIGSVRYGKKARE